MPMPNFLEMMRMKNVFNPQLDMSSQFSDSPPIGNNFKLPSFGSSDMGPMPQPASSGEFDPITRMRELYSPETGASERYNSIVGEYPQFEEPSGKRKIGAAILGSLTDLGTRFGGNKSGVKGTDVYEETTGKNKYRDAVTKWKDQIGPAGTAASLERGNNANERAMATSTVNQELTNMRDDARNTKNERDAKIREDRAAVYRFKAEHPNKKFDFSGPKVLIADPSTGEVINTGIETGSLSDSDKLDLQHKNRTAEIKTGGEEARTTEETRQDNRKELIPLQGAENRLTKGTPSGTLTNRGETPSATKVRQFTTAKEFAARNPALAKFIKFGKSNEFTISAPSKGGYFSSAGPTEAEHQQIINSIYGDSLPVGQPGRTGATPPPSTTPNTNTPVTKPVTKTPPVAPKGWKYVPKPGGGWTAVKG